MAQIAPGPPFASLSTIIDAIDPLWANGPLINFYNQVVTGTKPVRNTVFQLPDEPAFDNSSWGGWPVGGLADEFGSWSKPSASWLWTPNEPGLYVIESACDWRMTDPVTTENWCQVHTAAGIGAAIGGPRARVTNHMGVDIGSRYMSAESPLEWRVSQNLLDSTYNYYHARTLFGGSDSATCTAHLIYYTIMKYNPGAATNTYPNY